MIQVRELALLNQLLNPCTSLHQINRGVPPGFIRALLAVNGVVIRMKQLLSRLHRNRIAIIIQAVVRAPLVEQRRPLLGARELPGGILLGVRGLCEGTGYSTGLTGHVTTTLFIHFERYFLMKMANFDLFIKK